MDWEFPLWAAWAKDLGACLGAWGLVGLMAAVVAGGGEEGTLDTTGVGVGTFWKGAEGLVERQTLPPPLFFLLVTVVKRAFSTTG